MLHRLTPVSLYLLLAFGSSAPLMAADAPASQASEAELGAVTVSASALSLSGSAMSTPASVLTGDTLLLQREATLGETLAREPGISTSHFGAGASRPIIRGMDGPRVKLLSDGSEI